MDQNKFVITDKIKFAALEEVFNHFVEQRKGTKEQSPVAYYREVNEYTTEMVAYIIDNYKGEELCAVLAHFVPKFVKEQSPEGAPIVAADYLAKFKDGAIEHLKDSRQLRSFPTAAGKRVAAAIKAVKFEILRAAQKESGYRHERDYNELAEGYELTANEQHLAAVFETRLPAIAKNAQSVTLMAKTEGLGKKQ